MQMPAAEVLVLNFKTQIYALPKSVVNMDELKVVILQIMISWIEQLPTFEFVTKS